MTIKELKEILEGCDNNAEVFITADTWTDRLEPSQIYQIFRDGKHVVEIDTREFEP